MDSHRFKVVVAGRRWGKCLKINDLVTMSDGTLKKVQDIKRNDSVLTLNEDTYQIESKEVKHLHDNGVKETLLIKTKSGKELQATPNHPVLANNIWTELKDLKVGDLLATPKVTVFGNVEIDPYRVDLLAIWLAEGDSRGYTNSCKEIMSVMDKVADAFDAEFVDANVKESRLGLQWRWRGKVKGSNKIPEVLDRYLLLGKTSKTKFIPDDIFRLPKHQLARFLNLFVACDGSINRRSKKTWAMEIGLANERMIRQLAELFAKFGIHGNISKKIHKAQSSVTGENFVSWRFIVSDSRSLAIFCEEIGALSKEDRVEQALKSTKVSRGSCNSYLPISHDEFVKHLVYESFSKGKYGGYNYKVSRDLPDDLREQLNSWRKQTPSRVSVRRYEAIRKYSDGYFDPIADDGVIWDEIVSIENAEAVQTYDLTICDNHNFIANGIVTHNSTLSKVSIVRFASLPDKYIWYVAPTYRMSKQIMWTEMLDILPYKWIKRTNETIMRIELHNGTVIELKGSDKPDCYDSETEILTKDGWVKFPELKKGIDVLTLNPDTLTAEWQTPYKYVDQAYKGKMYKIESKKLDLLVSPEHKFLVKSGKGAVKLKEIEDISVGNDRIPARCDWAGVDISEMSHDMCALVGFYLAEGCAYGASGGDERDRGYPVFFSQTEGVKGGIKGNVREKFKSILNRLNFKYTENDIGINIQSKYLHDMLLPLGNKYTKRIPRAWLELPKDKLKVMLHWMILGDGSLRQKDIRYYTVSKGLADDVQELAIKAGYSANIVIKPQSISKINDREITPITELCEVRIYRNEFSHFGDSKQSYISKQDFDGRVYCVGVPNHVIMVRRNGKMCWSGNTLRGVGLDYIVLDEFQDMKPDVWKTVLRPTLATTGGHALFIGCVNQNTLVLPKGGAVEIQSLSKGSPDKTLDGVNIDLYGIDGGFHNADGFWNNGVVETKKMTTHNGFVLESSLPHPILTMGNDGIQVWKRTEDITVGDRVAIARGMNVWGDTDPSAGFSFSPIGREFTGIDGDLGDIVMTNDLAYLMGLWVAEGSCETNGRIRITCGDNIGDFLTSGKASGIVFKLVSGRKDQWEANSQHLLRYMEYIGMPLCKAPFKTLPMWVFRGRKEWAASFIAGMFDGGGYVIKTGNRVGYTSASERLVRSLQLLLSNFGIISRVTNVESMPTEKVAVSSMQWKLCIYGENIGVFRENIVLRINRKQELLASATACAWSRRDGVPNQAQLLMAVRNSCRRLYQNSKSKRHSFVAAIAHDSDISYHSLRTFVESHNFASEMSEWNELNKNLSNHYYWDEIVSVEGSESLTYDFTIPDTHSFWSNGFISHNTPKSYNILYDLYRLGQEGVQKSRQWRSWQFPTITSPFVPKEEIENARKDMDDKSFAQEFLASFSNMSGKVYYSFDREVNVWDGCIFNPRLPINIGQDFNIDPMSSAICQIQPNGEVWVVDEISLLGSNTQETCEEIERRYWRFMNQIIIYPDPAGGSKQHARGETDLDIFREKGFKKIKYRRKHPAVADRVNAVNRLIRAANGDVRLRIHPKCRNLIASLEQTIYKEGGRDIDKSQGIDHMGDAIGYMIEIEFPVRKIEIAGISL